MTDGHAPGYRHTQTGPWSVLLWAIGALMLGLGWFLRDEPVVPVVLPAAGAVMLVLGASVRHLTVADEGDRLAGRAAPLVRRRIRYDDVRS